VKIFRPVLGILVWLCFSVIIGQEIPKKLTIYSVGDGLSQSSVQSITQDIYGFIWISTGNGLNCFDGKNITSYFPPFDSKSSYKANRIRKVVCDDIGNLWVGSDDGLFFFNRITNKLEDPFPEIKNSMKGFCIPLFVTEDTLQALLANCCIMSINIRNHHFRASNLGSNVFKVIQTGNANETWCAFWPSNQAPARPLARVTPPVTVPPLT